jgi:CheY-like chemotaxis protein
LQAAGEAISKMLLVEICAISAGRVKQGVQRGLTRAFNDQPRWLNFVLLPPALLGSVTLIGGNVAESQSQTEGRNGVKKPAGAETGFKIVLSVSPNNEDRASLERIFKSCWTVVASSNIASILSALRETPIPIVIYDCDVSLGSWGEMLERISLLPDPPLFIVTSRLADDRLWAEALNLGAWDVLAKPFEADEVIRIVTIAGRHWEDRHGVYKSRTQQRKSATGAGYLAATGT